MIIRGIAKSLKMFISHDHQFYCLFSVIYIDFNYEGSRGEKSYRSLDQVAYADTPTQARATLTDSYGNPIVAYDTLDDVDAGRPSKIKAQPFNYVIPGYASGILEENETPTRSTNFDNQEARKINDDRIHFVDQQRNIFKQTANNPQIDNSQSKLPEESNQGVRSRPKLSQGILPPINDPLNAENIHLPKDPQKSEGVPASSVQYDSSKPLFFNLRAPIDDPLLPENIHLPNDPQKSEGVPALNSKPLFFNLRAPIDDPLLPQNIQLPSDPQKSEGLAATIFQNDNSVSHGLLPPIDDPLNTDKIQVPLNSQASEGFPSSLPKNRNSPIDGLAPPQLPNIDSPPPSFNSNPFLPPAVKNFNHPKVSTFNNNNDEPVIITDDQISFAPRPSNGLQPPKDPLQDVNVNFQAPTVSPSVNTPTKPKFSFNSAPTTQQTYQQIPVVVVQSPKVNSNKYKGSFGGSPGILSSNNVQFSGVSPTVASPQISPSTSSVTVNRRFQGGFGGAPGVLDSRNPLPSPSTTQNTFTTLSSGNVIAGSNERSVNKYQGNFGGPSGVLQPFDRKVSL